MNKEILNAILRTDFKSFVIKVFNDVSAGTKYLDNWHIDVICDAIMGMYDGESNRLIINIPPRYMKSIICSVALPAWLLGHDPKTNIICVSYNDGLSEKFANDCRNIMLSDWYRELFPMTHLHPSRRALDDFATTHGGGRMSTSIGGTLTGRGADWIIIDDPLKPADAMSDSQRDKVNDWYGSTLYSRLNDKVNGKILLIMQRLHQDDLSGFLLDSEANFRHIKLPVIATHDEEWKIKNRICGTEKIIRRATGEPLHPERENLDTINDLKSSLGEYAFASQYQQDPCPPEGGIVKESWLQYYKPEDLCKLGSEKPCRLYISWDTACKTGDNNAYSACCVVLMTHKHGKIKFYLLEVIKGRWEMPELVTKVEEIYNELKYDSNAGIFVKMLIEDMASGTPLLQSLNKRRDRRGYLFDLEAIKPEGDKVSRLMGISVYIQRGELLFPDSWCEEWWPDFKKELLSFPGNKYKDQVDALSQCITFAQQKDIS